MASRSLNKVMLIGNIVRDPELRYTPSGTAVCSFRLATNRSWTTDDGGKKEETEFHRIVAWNKLGELCSQLLTKGRKVYIEGRLQTRSWESSEGEKRYATEVVAEDMVLLDSKKSLEEKTEVANVVGDDIGDQDVEFDETPELEKAGEEKGEDKAEEAETKKAKKAKTKEESDEEAKEDEINIEDIPF